MTLKTGVMAAENSALPSQINSILKFYKNRNVILNGNSISLYYCFICIFDPNKCSLGGEYETFQKNINTFYFYLLCWKLVISLFV